MRVMVLIKANERSEAGEMPGQELLEQMTAYNEELVKAGVMLSADGLHPSSKGVRVEFAGSERKVIDGPFAETKELIAGFWLWQVRSMDEAVEWGRRMPTGPNDPPSEVEIRRVFETEEFAAQDPTGELRAQEHRLREESAALQQKAR